MPRQGNQLVLAYTLRAGAQLMVATISFHLSGNYVLIFCSNIVNTPLGFVQFMVALFIFGPEAPRARDVPTINWDQHYHRGK